MSWTDWSDYSGPREARGGIKAHSRRGAFGTTWWGRRWTETLEGFDVDGRIARGRAYARKGQVLTVDVEPGLVRASVQGSRPKPYAITIRLGVYDAVDWARAAGVLSQRPFFAARLLADALPPQLEAALADAGLALFPQRDADLETDCSCPDWSRPCKHVAAVFCLLAEEFDRDPFLLFRLRGVSRDALLALVVGEPSEAGTEPARAPTAPAVPLTADGFWQAGLLPDVGDVRTPPVPAALPRRLGAFPFWRGAAPLLETLEALYPLAARRGLEVSEGAAEAPLR